MGEFTDLRGLDGGRRVRYRTTMNDDDELKEMARGTVGALAVVVLIALAFVAFLVYVGLAS